MIIYCGHTLSIIYSLFEGIFENYPRPKSSKELNPNRMSSAIAYSFEPGLQEDTGAFLRQIFGALEAARGIPFRELSRDLDSSGGEGENFSLQAPNSRRLSID